MQSFHKYQSWLDLPSSCLRCLTATPGQATCTDIVLYECACTGHGMIEIPNELWACRRNRACETIWGGHPNMHKITITDCNAILSTARVRMCAPQDLRRRRRRCRRQERRPQSPHIYRRLRSRRPRQDVATSLANSSEVHHSPSRPSSQMHTHTPVRPSGCMLGVSCFAYISLCPSLQRCRQAPS